MYDIHMVKAGYYALIDSPLQIRYFNGQEWEGEIIDDHGAKYEVIDYVSNFELEPNQIFGEVSGAYQFEQHKVPHTSQMHELEQNFDAGEGQITAHKMVGQNHSSVEWAIKPDSDLLSVIANYLKSFWLLFISAFLGALALDISGNLHNEYLQCENNGNIFDRCTDSSGLPYLLLGLPSLIFFVIAILVGIRATTHLRRMAGHADQSRYESRVPRYTNATSTLSRNWFHWIAFGLGCFQLYWMKDLLGVFRQTMSDPASNFAFLLSLIFIATGVVLAALVCFNPSAKRTMLIAMLVPLSWALSIVFYLLHRYLFVNYLRLHGYNSMKYFPLQELKMRLGLDFQIPTFTAVIFLSGSIATIMWIVIAMYSRKGKIR